MLPRPQELPENQVLERPVPLPQAPEPWVMLARPKKQELWADEALDAEPLVPPPQAIGRSVMLPRPRSGSCPSALTDAGEPPIGGWDQAIGHSVMLPRPELWSDEALDAEPSAAPAHAIGRSAVLPGQRSDLLAFARGME